MKETFCIVAICALIGCERPPDREQKQRYRSGDLVETVLDGRRGQLTGAAIYGWSVRFVSASTNCEPYVTVNMQEHEFKLVQPPVEARP